MSTEKHGNDAGSEPTVHPTAGDGIPAGNERPFSTTLEDLYHNFKGVRHGFSHVLDEILVPLHRTGDHSSEALHVIAYAVLDRFDVALKELLWATHTLRRRGEDATWIGNDAALKRHGRGPAGADPRV